MVTWILTLLKVLKTLILRVLRLLAPEVPLVVTGLILPM